jgi:hypothetical protein
VSGCVPAPQLPLAKELQAKHHCPMAKRSPRRTAKKQHPLVTMYARTGPRRMVEFITEPNVRKGKDVEHIAAALEQPGVYVLFKGDVPHYAGRATNLRKRLLTHMRIGSRYGNLWDHVSLFVIADATHRSAVESIVIAAIGGAANSAKPRIKKIPVPVRAFKKWQSQSKNAQL